MRPCSTPPGFRACAAGGLGRGMTTSLPRSRCRNSAAKRQKTREIEASLKNRGGWDHLFYLHCLRALSRWHAATGFRVPLLRLPFVPPSQFAQVGERHSVGEAWAILICVVAGIGWGTRLVFTRWAAKKALESELSRSSFYALKLRTSNCQILPLINPRSVGASGQRGGGVSHVDGSCDRSLSI